ncbi:MAG: hypothetical protein ACQEXJ_13535 [Myxococcota bacterium]
MTTARKQFDEILATDPLDADRLAEVLDGMPEDDRVSAARSIKGKDQRRLWDACAGRATSLEDFVPAGVPPATEVIHAGKNSLPVFTTFEKRFARPEDRDDALYGYNEGATRAIVGPGFFVAHYFAERREVGVDYLQVPPAVAKLPAGWPDVKPNEKGVQKFVYAGTVDFMRKVSKHVTIGRAYKNGEEELPHTFVLCRTDR